MMPRDLIKRVIKRAESAELDCSGYLAWLKNDEFGGIERNAADYLERYDAETAETLLYLLTLEAYVRHATQGNPSK